MIERELEYWPPGAAAPTTIRVRIGAPEPADDGNYQSTLTIEGFDKPYRARFDQVDSLGALLAAAAIAPSTLAMRVAKGGRLTWLDQEDLGFPLLGPPKHYWTLHPEDGSPAKTISISVGAPEERADGWACLVTCTAPKGSSERWIQGATWASALEQAAAAVPGILQQCADDAGGGTLEEVRAPR